jgi:hypothetical protein
MLTYTLYGVLCLCPVQLVLLECANIALNLLQQQRRRLSQERQAEQLTGQAGGVSTGSQSDKPAEPSAETIVAATKQAAGVAQAGAEDTGSTPGGATAAGVQKAEAGSSGSNSSSAASGQIQQPGAADSGG